MTISIANKQEDAQPSFHSVITCPHCGYSKEEIMPANACVHFYTCENCGERLSPKAGDCCVFCSYGTTSCPPVQVAKKSAGQSKLLQTAFVLSLITIFYNLAEGAVSTFYGIEDETLALLGFGVDSFVEVLSGIGIAHMIIRMRRRPVESRDRFEVTALRITGIAFYILTAGLVVGAGLSVASQAAPKTTQVGIIIAILSIGTMYFLYKAKLNAGKKLDSQPIISDAHCTKTCFYLSFILLLSSLLHEYLSVPYVDAAGSLGIAWYSVKEGREAFEKARIKNVSDHSCSC